MGKNLKMRKNKMISKKKKAERLKENIIKGKRGEELTRRKWSIKHLGLSPKRDPYGQDFSVDEARPLSGRVQKTRIESKGNKSRLSKLQKKRKAEAKKKGERYVVERWRI